MTHPIKQNTFTFLLVTLTAFISLTLTLLLPVSSISADTYTAPASTLQQTSKSVDVTDVSESEYLNNIEGTTKIDGWTLINLLNSKQDFYLFIGYKECPYCREFSKTLKEFIPQADRPIYYLDLDSSLDDFEGTDEDMMTGILNGTIHFYGTPTFELLLGGEAKKEFVGSSTTLSDLQSLKTISMSQSNFK